MQPCLRDMVCCSIHRLVSVALASGRLHTTDGFLLFFGWFGVGECQYGCRFVRALTEKSHEFPKLHVKHTKSVCLHVQSKCVQHFSHVFSVRKDRLCVKQK